MFDKFILLPLQLFVRVMGFLTVFGLSACGEYIPFSGGELSGNLSPAPTEWSTLAQIDIIQLETVSETPYSVKLWIIGMDSSAYVHAGDNRTSWVENIESDSSVRLLVGTALYELKAQRVNGQKEFDRFSDIYEKKYGNRPGNENVQEAYLYRLGKRD